MKKIMCVLSLLSIGALALAGDRGGLAVAVFSAKEGVNAYVFSDGKGTLVVDTTRNSADARELAALVRSKGPAPYIILVTHGHPDHYLGMGALKREFPSAKIMVASEQIKEDIIGSAEFMESGGWLDGEPAMKVKTSSNPAGFDYQNKIGVLDSRQIKMPGGAVIEIDSAFPITEAPHETVLFSKDLNALFASDLVYNGVHLWLGNGVTAEAIQNWRNALQSLKRTYAPLKSKVYPGHGRVASAEIFDMDQAYMNDLVAAVKEARSPEAAKEIMMKKYPSWASPDFILTQSIKFQSKINPRQH